MARREQYPKLKNQPLSLVLAEFRFNPILKIGDAIPDLQERLRKHYPRFSKQDETMVLLFGPHGQVDKSPQEIRTSWLFASANQRQALKIDSERLIFFCTDYDRFPEFCKSCLEAIEILQSQVNPELLLRVGLRYNDVIVPQEGDTLTDYLDPTLVPTKAIDGLNGILLQHRAETIWTTSVGKLAIRSYFSNRGLAVMPDLHQRLPVITRDDVPAEITSAVLDFDHFWDATGTSEEILFKLNNAKQRLSGLHQIAREAFWKVTTDFARNERWA